MNRVVRRCFLLGIDPLTGKNYDHRKGWMEELFQHLAACFGIDLLCFSILSNHFHLVLRSRPDVVKSWDDAEASQTEINVIVNDAARVAEIRRRLSDISWWMRLLCQNIGTRANLEDGESGKFWQARFRAVKILDDEALLACAAYVDLNPIRAAMAEKLEQSDYTSVQRRIQSLQGGPDADSFLSPIMLDELIGSHPSLTCQSRQRCSDHGFLPVKLGDYLELLDWTARQTMKGKPGSMPATTSTILDRLSIDAAMWCELVGNFGRLFYHVAGKPRIVDDRGTRVTQRRFNLRRQARDLLTLVA